MFTELNANKVRAIESPFSFRIENCSSWPGRASCAASDHETAGKLKSSYAAVVSPGRGGGASGIRNQRSSSFLNSACTSSVGDDLFAASPAVERRTCTGRDGNVTSAR